MGNFKKALIDYGNILDKDPDNKSALQACGYIYQQLEDYEQARQYFDRLLRIDSDN